jgi:HK97 family phage major capsid protein
MSKMMTINMNEVLERNSAEIRKLREKGDEIVARQISEDRDLTKEETTELTAVQDKIVELRNRAERIERQLEIGSKLDQPGAPKTQRDRKPGEMGAGGEDAETRAAETEKRYKRAFSNYLRNGVSALGAEDRDALNARYTSLPSEDPEVRAMSALTGVSGGFVVPADFVASVEVAMKEYSGVLKAGPTIINTSTGADLAYPTVNDTANEGEQVEENSTVSDRDVTGFGTVTFKSFLFSSRQLLVPIQLIQDAAINVESLLSGMMAERLGRIVNKRYTSGNGANQPQGIVNASVLGATAASASAITADELIDLQHSVDPAYRNGAKFKFSDGTFKAIRKLKDGDGRPIWMPSMTSSIAAGAPGTLLGDPYVINVNMDGIAAGKRSVLYGQMSKYYVRNVRNMVVVRLSERYAEKFQIGYFGFMRCDGRIIDAGSNPIRHLVHP